MGDPKIPKGPPILVSVTDKEYCLGLNKLYEGATPEEIDAQVTQKPDECKPVLKDAYYLHETCRLLGGNEKVPRTDPLYAEKEADPFCKDVMNEVLGRFKKDPKVQLRCKKLQTIQENPRAPGDKKMMKSCDKAIADGIRIYQNLRSKNSPK